MEKLQAAIERAREQRAKEEPAPPVLGTATKVDEPTVDGAPWDRIEALDLSERQAARNRVFLSERANESSYFDKLRTRVLQQCRDNDWKRVAITSATKACGKTTISLNLAASFTRQADRRVVLLDFDMRRPEISRQLSLRAPHGFSDVLEESSTFEDVAVRMGENVIVAANQKPHPNPSRLLLKDRLSQILDEIEQTYAPDLVFFDTPPLFAADDTLALLKHVDCAIIIAAAERSTVSDIDTVEKEIAAQTNVMGVVLNRCIYMERKEKYYYQ